LATFFYFHHFSGNVSFPYFPRPSHDTAAKYFLILSSHSNLTTIDFFSSFESSDLLKRKKLTIVCQYQGNHIGRIFTHWVVVYFWQFSKNYKSSANLWTTFSQCTYVLVVYLFWQKLVWLHIGWLFQKRIRSPWPIPTSPFCRQFNSFFTSFQIPSSGCRCLTEGREFTSVDWALALM
jgi:hypothetical protein